MGYVQQSTGSGKKIDGPKGKDQKHMKETVYSRSKSLTMNVQNPWSESSHPPPRRNLLWQQRRANNP